MRGFQLYLVGAIASAAEIDCTGYRPYSSAINGNPSPQSPFKAHMGGVGYSAKTYVGVSDVPGSNQYGPWVSDGDCIPGTATDVDDPSNRLPEIDCTGFRPYSSAINGNPPTGSPFRVHAQGVGYTAKTYVASSDVPGASQYGPWTAAGRCAAGTASDVDDPSTDLPEMDCTGYRPYSNAITGNPPSGNPFKAHHANVGYQAKTYVGVSDVPGDSQYGPWVAQGKCAPGTASTEDNKGAGLPEMDCTGFRPWSSAITGNPDPAVGFKAHKDNVGYTAMTFVAGSDVPGEGGEFAPWKAVGQCKAGTASETDDPGASLPEVDCSGFRPWVATNPITGNPPAGQSIKAYVADTKVAYESTTYVDKTTAPGVPDDRGYSPWAQVGKCMEGTMSDGLDPIDCSEYHAWSPYYPYTGADMLTDKDHAKDGIIRLWRTNWWTEGELPEEKEDGPYSLLGKCKEGTATLGPSKEVPPQPQWKLDLTCNCCSKCGAVIDGQVRCLDDKTQENCWYQWCGDKNELDEEKCNYSKDHQLFAYWGGQFPPGKKEWPKQVYAPYFDSGLAKYPPLTSIIEKYGVNHFVIAFIVSTTLPQLMTGECQGAYAGAISVNSGPISYFEDQGSLYLYDELVRVREAGGDFVVSFGGANGTELADSAECQKGDPVANLAKEYGRILDILNTNRIDFDIEGQAYAVLQKEKGWTYRFNAVKQLKQERPDLHVTWTLPILPTGLTPADGMAFIQTMFELDAPFNVINVMNMDYGDCSLICKNEEIDKCERDAMDNLVQQLYDTAKAYGKDQALGWASPEDVWPYVGSTPMLGKNDVTCLTYTLDAAKTNLKYWQEKKLGMLSNWSLHRDMPCPSSQSVSVDCSSYDGQVSPYDFASIFSAYGTH